MQLGWRGVLRPILTAQLSVAASMLIGDTACQYIAKGRQPITPIESITPSTSTALSAATITPLVATSPVETSDGLTLTIPPPPSTAIILTPVLRTEDPLPNSPLPDVRYLSAHLPHWWDPQRSLVMLCTGLFVSGPWSAFTFTGTEWLFPGRSTRAILSKVILNALTAPVGISLMFSTVKLLEGHTLSEAGAKVRESAFSTWITGAAYWPFVSVLNFRFVPFEWRPLFSGLAGAAWQTYMSAQAHKPVGAAAVEAGGGGGEWSGGAEQADVNWLGRHSGGERQQQLTAGMTGWKRTAICAVPRPTR